MNRFAMILTVVILPAWVLPAPADGIFGLFSKRTKVNPTQRVPELIMLVKTEQDERKRSSAAAELGSYDAAMFTEIVPVLVDVLQHDPRPGVRMDAASSLGNARPVSQLAGQALEKAQSDDNLRVRWHAKTVLMRYRMAGYAPGARIENGPKTQEPPLLEPNAAQPTKVQNPQTPLPQVPLAVPAQVPAAGTPFITTSQTKLPAPETIKDDTPTFRPSASRPMPQGTGFSTAVPQQQSTRQVPTPAPMTTPEGPLLTPSPRVAPIAPPPLVTPAAPPVVAPPVVAPPVVAPPVVAPPVVAPPVIAPRVVAPAVAPPPLPAPF